MSDRKPEPVTRNVFRLYCQSESGCKKATIVQASMLIGALREAERHHWSTSGKLNLCPAHAHEREQSKPGRRPAAAAAAKK